MSVTIGIPQPSEPKPVPNRWVWVRANGYVTNRKTLPTPSDLFYAGADDTLYLLPGTALTAALAELERASVQIEEDCDYHGKTINENVAKWLNARRRVRDLLGEGRGK